MLFRRKRNKGAPVRYSSPIRLNGFSKNLHKQNAKLHPQCARVTLLW
jgi:hypothetical protein